MSIIVIGKGRVPEESKAEGVIPAMIKVMEETSKEEGNEAYIFSRDLKDPLLFHFYEKYTSQEALDAHMGTAHLAEFIGAMGEAGITDTEVIVYETSSEKNMFGGE